MSAFGGIVAFNGDVDADAAEAMAEVFTEVVIAPSYTAAAGEAFAQRPNLRLVAAPMPTSGGLDVRPLPGGALIQDRDTVSETRADWKVVSSREPTAQEWADLELAWTIAWRVKSNTIVLVKDGATVGVGAGQMSRVDSSWIATRKAGDRAQGAVLASDAFFPFPDALEVAADAGCARRDPSRRFEGRRRGARGGRGARHGRRAHRTPALPTLTREFRRRAARRVGCAP